jgi:hypothetical protein
MPMKCISALGSKIIRLNQVGGSMKMTTFKKFLGLGMMLAAFAIAGAVPATAQGCDDTEGHGALYGEIVTNSTKNNDIVKQTKKGDKATLEVLVGLTKDYLQKYGECNKEGQSFAANVNWVKTNAPIWEKALETVGVIAVYDKYVSELGSAKWDDAITTSKELLRVYPKETSTLNIVIPLASLGLVESLYKKNDKYVDISIQYAKLALEKMKAGEVAVGNAYGISPYSYGNKDDATSEMKFVLGYLLTVKKGDKKNGVTYLYEVAQGPGANKTNPVVFIQIGEYYLEQAKKIGDEISPLQKQLNAADEEIKKAGTTEERISELNKQKIDLNNQIVAKEGYYFAWVERAIDSYSRAYKSAKDVTPADKQYRKSLYDRLAAIYEDRFKKKDGIDSYIATAVAKPMENPTTDVTPVAAPAAETTSSGASAVVAKPEAAPASALTTKPAVATVQPSKTTTAKAKPKK